MFDEVQSICTKRKDSVSDIDVSCAATATINVRSYARNGGRDRYKMLLGRTSLHMLRQKKTKKLMHNFA
jgi:hypothetical protein